MCNDKCESFRRTGCWLALTADPLCVLLSHESAPWVAVWWQRNISPGLLLYFLSQLESFFCSVFLHGDCLCVCHLKMAPNYTPTPIIIIQTIIEQPLVHKPVPTRWKRKEISHRKSKQFLQLSPFILLNVFSASHRPPFYPFSIGIYVSHSFTSLFSQFHSSRFFLRFEMTTRYSLDSGTKSFCGICATLDFFSFAFPS